MARARGSPPKKHKGLKSGPKGGRPAHKTDPKIVAMTKRNAEIVQLRIDGHSLETIGREYKLTAPRVHQIITASLAEFKADTADQLRQIESARLDQMTVPLLAKAVGGDIFSAQTVLSISARRARMYGLDSATKIESTGRDGGPIEQHVSVTANAAASFDAKFAAILVRGRPVGISAEPDAGGEGGESV